MAWTPIPGLAGRYMASRDGRIKGPRGRVLMESMNSAYATVTIYPATGPRQTRTVHSLIALAFHGERPEGTHVDHIDRDSRNNAAKNLRYVTPVRNNHNRHGTYADIALRGSRHACSKLTESEVSRIRRLRVRNPAKWTNAALAEKFGVSPSLVSYVVSGKGWTHVPVLTQCQNSKAPYAKLTKAKVRQLRDLRRKDSVKWSQRKLAEKFGVSQAHVQKILAGEAWRDEHTSGHRRGQPV